MRLLWWLLTVVGVGLFSVVLSHQHALDPLENLSLSITSPMGQGLQGAAEPIADFFEGVVDRGDLVRENRLLQAEVARLRAELAGLQDIELRYQELAGLLEVEKGRPQEQFLVANVIGQDSGNLRRTIAIDRGVSDGVEEGMVVLAEGGSLVGTVSRAFDDFAWVTLITDADSVVNALVQEANVRGVVSGDLRRGLVVDMVPATAQLQRVSWLPPPASAAIIPVPFSWVPLTQWKAILRRCFKRLPYPQASISSGWRPSLCL